MPILSSLKRALTVNFLLVAALPVLFFGLVSINLMESYQLEGIREQNMAMANVVAEESEGFLLEVKSDLHHVEETLNSKKIIQPDGKNDFLGVVVRNSQFFESIYLLNNDRKIVHLGVMPQLYSRRDDYAHIDFSSHQLFTGEQEFKQPTWSNTFVSLETGEPSVTLGLPVRQGALLGNIRLISLSKLLQRYATKSKSAFAIIDRTGALIAHSDVTFALQRLNFRDHPVVVSAMDGLERTEEHAHGPGQYLESVALIPQADWMVWASLDMNVVRAPIRDLRNLFVGFMALAITLAGIIAIINVRRLMFPLTALGLRASQIADGRYGFHFRPSGFEEIDTLGTQFANMSDAIMVREQSIVASEKRFRNLVNSIDGIVFEMDYRTSRFLFVSRQAETLLGHPVKDWLEIENFWAAKAHPDDVKSAQAYCRLMSEKHEDHDFEFRMLAADGRWVWIRNLVSVVVGDDRPDRLIGVMIDITPHKELLDNLQRSERNYREIFNATSEAIFIHDMKSGEILDVNEAMLTMFGYEYEEATKLSLGEISFNEGPFRVFDALEKIREAAKNGSAEFEWRSRRKSGEIFWSDFTLKRAMIGEQERVIAVVRDVTKRKSVEAQLLNYRTHLEDLVNERTEQLEDAQAKLVQKERLAVLGQLTATVSHEIRNPLGTIANSIFLLQEALDGLELSGWERPLLLAERNVERCDGIISELLDFSRQREIQLQPLGIDGWLTELLDEMTLPETLDLLLDLASGAVAKADPERLRRALINVLTNAVQALDELTEKVPVLKICTRLNLDRCEIDVVDNGPGMSPEVMAQIFEPMFSTKNFGVGLGVPIIKNIIDDHGGGVEYRSEEGKGTTVAIWLPITTV